MSIASVPTRVVSPYWIVAAPASITPWGSPPGAGNERPSSGPIHRTRNDPFDDESTTAHAAGMRSGPPIAHSAVMAATAWTRIPTASVTVSTAVPT